MRGVGGPAKSVADKNAEKNHRSPIQQITGSTLVVIVATALLTD